MLKSKIILGIDPGYGITGYGLVECVGSRLKALDYGVIETSSHDEFPERLKTLNTELSKIIKKYKPNLLAVEDLFFYKNVTTAMKVAQARGVVILSAVLAKIPIVEFTPLQVKQAISSYGRAGKNQVQQMVKVFLSLETIPKPDDAADALAVAICAANSHRLQNIIRHNK
ncbi:MAG: Crossover junction endodeoxyribonuclease RuvC [Parcubacteria group bacterium GW2011_GWC2_38_7]|nr:MAG: Crossover junction endodeoxyribonuclease RuvC [Parcubacteria group bacterium GW2011_GWC2_38_7]